MATNTDFFKTPTETGFDVFEEDTNRKLSENEAFGEDGLGLNIDLIPLGGSSLTLPNPQPADTTSADNLSGIFGGIQNELAQLTQESEERAADVTQEKEAAEQERQGLLDRVTQFFRGRRGERELLEEELTRFGVIEDLGIARGLADQIGAANTDIANLKERRDQAVAQVEGASVSQTLINRRAATQEKRYNSRINAAASRAGALAVQLEAVRGNITQARAVANDVVNAALADQNAELQEIQFFFDVNESLIQELGKEEREALNQVRQDKLNELNLKKEEKQTLLNIMIQNPNAGITVDDGIEQALGKVGARDEFEYKRDLSLKFPGAGIDAKNDNLSVALEKANKEAMIDVQMQRRLTQTQIANINSQISTRRQQLALQAAQIAASQASSQEGEQADIADATRNALAVQTTITDLRKLGERRGLLGVKALDRETGFSSVFPSLPFTRSGELKRKHDQLKSVLTLDKIKNFKGAISDKDLEVAQQAASSLDLNMSKDAYLSELQKIERALTPDLDKAVRSGAVDPIDIGAAMGLDATDIAEIDARTGGDTDFDASQFFGN